jgi:aryl-alcohol dehydrogenase-like predicted oxidoreductase
MGLSGAYGPSDEASAIAMIHAALDRGVTLLDTADAYGVGHNEELIGKALRDRRARAFVATKFGTLRDAQNRLIGLSGKPAYVASACDASLRRLGTETIDLLYLHRVDPDTPIEDTVGAMERLVEAGKVRYLGLSEAHHSLRRAHAVHPITALQSEYSIGSRDIEAAVLPLCRELGIGFVAYGTLGRGLLTGQMRTPDDLAAIDLRRGTPRFAPDNLRHNTELVAGLTAIAQDRGVTVAQLALAWVQAQGGDIVAIAGMKTSEHLAHNLAATELALTAEDKARIEAALPPGALRGDRYPQPLMSSLGR